MTVFILKIIAMLTMAVDHIGFAFVDLEGDVLGEFGKSGFDFGDGLGVMSIEDLREGIVIGLVGQSAGLIIFEIIKFVKGVIECRSADSIN